MLLYVTGIYVCRVESERWYQQQQTVEIDLKTEKMNSWTYSILLLILLYVHAFNLYLNLWYLHS